MIIREAVRSCFLDDIRLLSYPVRGVSEETPPYNVQTPHQLTKLWSAMSAVCSDWRREINRVVPDEILPQFEGKFKYLHEDAKGNLHGEHVELQSILSTAGRGPTPLRPQQTDLVYSAVGFLWHYRERDIRKEYVRLWQYFIDLIIHLKYSKYDMLYQRQKWALVAIFYLHPVEYVEEANLQLDSVLEDQLHQEFCESGLGDTLFHIAQRIQSLEHRGILCPAQELQSSGMRAVLAHCLSPLLGIFKSEEKSYFLEEANIGPCLCLIDSKGQGQYFYYTADVEEALQKVDERVEEALTPQYRQSLIAAAQASINRGSAIMADWALDPPFGQAGWLTEEEREAWWEMRLL